MSGPALLPLLPPFAVGLAGSYMLAGAVAGWLDALCLAVPA